jgi:uncharacterized repeat protein (TIGR01451 family)
MQPKKAIITGLVAVAAILTVTWTQAQAGTKGHIKLTSTAWQEKQVFNQEGKKELKRVPAAKVLPGDEVIFTISYENIGKESAENAQITDPIPEHMVYTQDSVEGADARITFSADGGKTYHIPGKLFVFDAAGRQFPARPQDYTHIRWTFEKPLPPGAKGEVSFRAILK